MRSHGRSPDPNKKIFFVFGGSSHGDLPGSPPGVAYWRVCVLRVLHGVLVGLFLSLVQSWVTKQIVGTASTNIQTAYARNK